MPMIYQARSVLVRVYPICDELKGCGAVIISQYAGKDETAKTKRVMTMRMKCFFMICFFIHCPSFKAAAAGL